MSERPEAASRQNPSASTSDSTAHARETRAENPKLSQSQRIERLETTFGQFYQRLPLILADERKMILAATEEADNRLLDSLIDMLTKKENERQGIPLEKGGQPSASQQSGEMMSMVHDFMQMGKELGFLGNETPGYGPVEQRFVGILSKGYENFLRGQEREFARKFGIPVHEEEVEHG